MQLKLHYFDFHGGRGEPARLMLTMAGIPFVDHRIKHADWPGQRDRMPLKALPVLEIDSYALTQSTTINRFVARKTGLYPQDPWQAIPCDEVCDLIEDLNHRIGRTFGIQDPDQFKRLREELVAGPLTLFLGRLESMLTARGEWFAGGSMSVADLVVFVMVRALNSGHLDHVPEDLVSRIAPQVQAHAQRVGGREGVRDYYAAPGA